MNKILNVSRVLALVILTVCNASSNALAVIYIYDCDSTVNTTTCNTNCQLVANLTCEVSNANDNGITLTNGADLDMDGYSISFTGNNLYKPAVTAGANSVVKNSNGTDSSITGDFGYTNDAIRCTSTTNTKVVGININISTGDGIDGCETAQDNVVTSATIAGTGISVVNADNNYVHGFQYGMDIYGTADHNIIMTKASQSDGIQVSGIASSITGNLIFGPATNLISLFGGSPAFAENYCDSTAANCASCISSGYCRNTTPAVPFAFP